MPSVIISPSSNSSRTIISPPPGAFQAPMRILKRPTSTTSPGSAYSDTLKDRHARYLKARERIFGEDAESREHSVPSSSSASPVPPSSPEKLSNESTQSRILDSKPPAAVVSVVRNPRGPSNWSEDNEQASTDGNMSPRGFEGRRGKPPSSEEQVG
jgi:SUZ domain